MQFNTNLRVAYTQVVLNRKKINGSLSHLYNHKIKNESEINFTSALQFSTTHI